MNQTTIHCYFSGRVQGVGFRATCAYEARKLNLRGWVKNLYDGRVEAYIQGPQQDIDQLFSNLKNEKTWIRIDTIDQMMLENHPQFPDFQVR